MVGIPEENGRWKSTEKISRFSRLASASDAATRVPRYWDMNGESTQAGITCVGSEGVERWLNPKKVGRPNK